MKNLPNKKKSKLKIIALIVLTALAFIAFQYFSSQRDMEERRAASAEQQQVLVESWQAQGLTDEEIEQKLAEDRQTKSDGSQSHSIFGVVRRMTGSAGPGRK